MPTHLLFLRPCQGTSQEKKGKKRSELNFQILLHLFPLQFGIVVLGQLIVVSASMSSMSLTAYSQNIIGRRLPIKERGVTWAKQ